MYNSTQVKDKLNSLVSGAVSAGFDETQLNAMLTDLRNAITTFYNLDFATPVSLNIEMLTHALIRTGIVYKDYTAPTTTGTKPTGFDDVTQLFTVGSSIMSTEQSAFNADITQALGADGVTYTYSSNLVDVWLNEYLNAKTVVPANLALIAEFAGNYGIITGVRILYDAPEIVSVPDIKDLAEDIIIDRKYKELVNTLSLDVWLPV